MTYFFNGYAPYYPGLTRTDLFKVVAYHTPYYFFNNDCSSAQYNITDLKDFHLETSLLSGTACIVDTDGDTADLCDGSETWLYVWATRTYDDDDGTGFHADFNAKCSRTIPDANDMKLMRRIDDAWKEQVP